MFGHYGNSKQFRRDLELLWERLYRLSFSICHDRHLAADLVQSTVEAALRHKHKIPDLRVLEHWLFKVLVNKWRDHCRTRKSHTSIDDMVDLMQPGTPEAHHDQKEAVRRVYTAMSRLSEEHREVLALVAVEGFSYEQVAGILDLPVGTVMSRLSRSRKCLRVLLADTGLSIKKSGASIRIVK